ncbi:phage integrase [Undibacterium sp. RuTC16W]|uniref:phage integrase n=1 Tax=Undibacterium sp. RuTC16W TaxID=3413048 RepID=UPI003BF060CB
MKADITRELLRGIAPRVNAFDINDTKLPGFLVRVMPSGAITFNIRFTNSKGVRDRHSLKLSYPSTTISIAREKAVIALGKIQAGEDPAGSRKAIRDAQVTLFGFIDGDYGNHLKIKTKSHTATVDRLKQCFEKFKDRPLSMIDALTIEQWRAAKIAKGWTASTVNRDIGALKPLFSRAVEWKLIADNPLKSVKPLKCDSDPIVRYLTEDEEYRLRIALDRREASYRADRISANIWRAKRRCELLPEIREFEFKDYLQPAVLLSLNTGIRQGELIQLRWIDVDLDKQSLSIRGETAKSGKIRHVPLNDEALHVLRKWQSQLKGTNDLVFPGRDGKPIAEVKTAWRNLLVDAGIIEFRWHDMRHHFASMLVMNQVDLNSVRELLGHADLKMTLRYAHLAPEHKMAAVQKLMNRRKN